MAFSRRLNGRVSWILGGCVACLFGQAGCHGVSVRRTDQGDGTPAAGTRPAISDSAVGIIVDIDETISITDYRSLLLGVGKDQSKPYENAREVLTELSHDFAITYLTSRPQWLTGETHEWLRRHGFPAGKVLATARMVDVYWPGSFKIRAIAVLRRTSPHLLVGIGDRPTDVQAYLANGMLALVVNPRGGVVYDPRTVILQDWREVRTYFETNTAVLGDPDALRTEYGVGRLKVDPSTVQTRMEVDPSLPLELLMFVPTSVVESVVKLKAAHEQAEAKRALGHEGVDMAKALDQVLGRFGESNILEVRLSTEGDDAVYVVTYARDWKIYEVELDTHLSAVEDPEVVPLPGDDPLQARDLARITLRQAFDLAVNLVEGEVYEIELEMDDKRPTYEIALLSLGRFMEIEVDAETGEVLEVEDETAIR